jgi:uncharacterized protein YjbI with pentapeptide repeats
MAGDTYARDNLSSAILRGAYLGGANLQEANLIGARADNSTK